jgi:PAS domain-containing protein
MAQPSATATALLTPADQRAPEHVEPTPCHMYPGLCVRIDGEEGDAVDEDGRHFDHGSYTYTVPSGECPEDDPEIWAQFVHVSSGVPKIGFMGEDLTPDQARERASELRRMADDMDALADQVGVACSLFNLRKIRETADPAFAEILNIMEAAVVEDGCHPADVGDQVLDLLVQARAERRATEARS